MKANSFYEKCLLGVKNSNLAFFFSYLFLESVSLNTIRGSKK